jgi:Ca2+-binding EF-hand superfamily protein
MLVVCCVPICWLAGSTSVQADDVLAALLLWELQQHVGRLETTVEAFKAADQRRSGTLDIHRFRVFCQQLNDAMSEEEVLLLWQELDKQGAGSITFSTLCACLLPVMSDGA